MRPGPYLAGEVVPIFISRRSSEIAVLCCYPVKTAVAGGNHSRWYDAGREWQRRSVTVKSYRIGYVGIKGYEPKPIRGNERQSFRGRNNGESPHRSTSTIQRIY